VGRIFWFYSTQWTDPNGRTRFWESAERRTRSSSGVDGVAIVAKCMNKNEQPKTLIISQYRPPLGSFCLEIPAGLVDEGEDVETAALRELKEETGYCGKLISLSPVCYNDPGLTNANMMMAIVEVDMDAAENRLATQELHDGEFITVQFAPWNDLLSWLFEKRKAKGYDIDARLLSFAMGMHQASISAPLPLGGEMQPTNRQEKSQGKHHHGRLLKRIKVPNFLMYAAGVLSAALVSALMNK